MSEQTAVTTGITSMTQSMRRQSDEVVRSATEQGRAAKDMKSALENISRELGSVTSSNRQHLEAFVGIVRSLAEIQQITMTNARSAETLSEGATGLNERATQLSGLMDSMTVRNREKGVRKKTKTANSSQGSNGQ
jgi:methyl-accepting chemotaxis protein